MTRADELIDIREPDGTWRRVRRGEPSARIETDPHTGRHRVRYYIGGRELWDLGPSYRWMWRARRAAARWLAAERQAPTLVEVE